MKNNKEFKALVLERVEDIRWWRASGLTYQQVARRLGCKPQVLYMYKHSHPELEAALDYYDTKILEEMIVPALMDRALNGTISREVIEEPCGRDKDGEIKYKIVRKITKHTFDNKLLLAVAGKLDAKKWGNAKEAEQEIDQCLLLTDEIEELSQ